ncbi:MAG TPA: dihydrolipoamide acetyltransferase family protein [Mycobacteriales bacterium]|nr:dihydrolipoamide acetyltransferase family protein [Mycobacteriales bacterium]
MPTFKQFRLPDAGEGLTEAEILKWYVKPGDLVVVNQTIVEIETAKAAVELPSPFAGAITELLVPEGATVDVGTPIVTVDVDPDGAPGVPAQAQAAEDLVPSPPADEAVEPGLIGSPAPGGRTAVLVGYGPRSVVAKRRARKGSSPAPVATVHPEPEPEPVPEPPAPREPVRSNGSGQVAVLAKPPVRKLARDLGVDLATVNGSGRGGVITRADIETAAQSTGQPAAEPVAAPAAAVWDGTREQRIPIKGVRKHTAAAMVSSAFTAPHVTEWMTVDMTETMRLRDRVAAMPDFVGIKVSPLLFVARALLLAVRRHPMINSAWDEQAQEIVVKEYVNLGIAAATPRGLVVPNIKDAARLSVRELAEAIKGLTDTARAGKTTPADMSGGTITITNVGVFGVDGGTPILNPGETAILALGSVREMPWVVDGQLAVRQVTQLSLSFDHRIVDGQLGSQFLADLAAMLADPSLALAWG